MAEIHEDNNIRSRVIQIGADLTVWIDVAGSSATATPGSTITVTDITKNDSDGEAGPSTTKFYLSTNRVLDAGAILLGSRAVPALAAHATNSRENTLPLPLGIGGLYYVIAEANGEANGQVRVRETNTANNITVATRTIRVGPDLVVWTDVPAASKTPPAGATISVTDYTRNDSDRSPVGASMTRIYLSPSPTLDGAVEVASRAVPALGPGEIHVGSTTFALPAGHTGTRYIIAKADADDAIFESNEANNTSPGYSIIIGADLIVWIDVPGIVANSVSGATVTVTDWTRNDNAAPAGPSTTKFYLIKGTTLDGKEELLGSRAIPALPPSTTNTGTTTLTLPGAPAGDVPDHRQGGRGRQSG